MTNPITKKYIEMVPYPHRSLRQIATAVGQARGKKYSPIQISASFSPKWN